MANAPATKTVTPPAEEEALSFMELVPGKAQKSTYSHLKSIDGSKIDIKDVANESNDANAKFGWYVTLNDDRRFAVPTTIAKKVLGALQAAAAKKKEGKGNGHVRVTVKALERGVRIS